MSTVVIFGAGATKACGGPMTNEILYDAFRERYEIRREDFLPLLDDFLVENFHLPKDVHDRRREDYPGLPLLMSLLDTAIDRRHALSANWAPGRLGEVRDALEYVIFALLEHRLRHLPENHYLRFLEMLKGGGAADSALISLNYDLIADNALIQWGQSAGKLGVPDYGCDVATTAYNDLPRIGRLFKLHGSLNWLYCPGCHRLDVGLSSSGKMFKILDTLYRETPLEDRYSCTGAECAECGANVRPVIVTPSYLKDYRNPHISRTWYEAERALRRAGRVIFVGYSLPEDDLAVTYLLKRSLSHLHGPAVTVVEYDDQQRPLRDHPVGARYRTLFGDQVDWRTEGFGAWLDAHAKAKHSPAAGPLPN